VSPQLSRLAETRAELPFTGDQVGLFRAQPGQGGVGFSTRRALTHPFNPFDEFANEFRVIATDLRNAKGGQSTGLLETGRAWDAALST